MKRIFFFDRETTLEREGALRYVHSYNDYTCSMETTLMKVAASLKDHDICFACGTDNGLHGELRNEGSLCYECDCRK